MFADRHIKILIVLLFLINPVSGLNKTEKKLAEQFYTAISRKSYKDLDMLIPSLSKSEISDNFRLDYCKKLLATHLTSSLSQQALENQRVKESVDIINSIYYNLYKKTNYSDNKKDTKRPSLLLKDKYNKSRQNNTKHMLLFSKTAEKAKKALYSLTGFSADNPEAFNWWWSRNRSAYTIKPKGAEDQDPAHKNDKEPPIELKVKMPPNPNRQFWSRLEDGSLDRQYLFGTEDEEEILNAAAPKGCTTIRTKHFLIISDLDKASLQALAKKVEGLYGLYEKQFGVSVDPEKMLRYYNLRREMYARPLRKTETMKIACFTSGSNYGTFVRRFFKGSIEGGQGFNNTEHNICVFRRISRSTLPFEGTLAHECTHLFAGAAFCRVAKGNIPLWLSEGGATYRSYFPGPKDCIQHSMRMFKQVFGSNLEAINNDFRAYVMGLKGK